MAVKVLTVAKSLEITLVNLFQITLVSHRGEVKLGFCPVSMSCLVISCLKKKVTPLSFQVTCPSSCVPV